jgi:hypothetical protein
VSSARGSRQEDRAQRVGLGMIRKLGSGDASARDGRAPDLATMKAQSGARAGRADGSPLRGCGVAIPGAAPPQRRGRAPGARAPPRPSHRDRAGASVAAAAGGVRHRINERRPTTTNSPTQPTSSGRGMDVFCTLS